MPTMSSRRLSDLKAERECFILHEQRIIQERDEILKNLRQHLDQLDLEIVRLGGTARRHLHGGTAAPSNDEGLESPIARFPPTNGDSSQQPAKRPRGRPRKSEEGGGFGSENKAKKEESPDPEKENVSSNNASSSSNDEASPSDDPKKKNDCTNKTKTPVDSEKKNEELKLRKVGGAKQKYAKKKRKRSTYLVPRTDADAHEAWTCECGEHLAAGRKRCGKCRRWRGGHRETRWSIKPIEEEGKTPSRVMDAYRALAAEDTKSSVEDTKGSSLSAIDVAVVLAGMGFARPAADATATAPPSDDAAAGDDSRAEVESIIGQMVSAVERAAAAVRTKSKGSKRKISSSNDGDNESAKGEAARKRKRGRPRKKSERSEAKGEMEIRRVVSTSDSDGGATNEAPRKQGRPTKEPSLGVCGSAVTAGSGPETEVPDIAFAGKVATPKESPLGVDGPAVKTEEGETQASEFGRESTVPGAAVTGKATTPKQSALGLGGSAVETEEGPLGVSRPAIEIEGCQKEVVPANGICATQVQGVAGSQLADEPESEFELKV